MNKKIILLASERSGTNLLRTLIANHKDISGPVAPHFFDAFNASIKKYGDLEKKENALLLLRHMRKLANHNYHDWKFEVNEEDLYEKYSVNSFESAFNALYLEKSIENGKKHYVSKDNHLFNYVNILNNLEDVVFVYLYRDPRDHVASWLRTPLFMHSTFDIINKWVKEQNIILNIAKTHNVLFVSYEDLISNTEETMTNLLNNIGVEVDSNCFQTDSGNKESKRNEFWKNLSKPIIKDNFKKYKELLSNRDIKIIEGIAGEIMQKLGYDLETNANWKPYKGYKYELKIKRALSKRKHQKLFDVKMKTLQEKLELIKGFRKEVN